MTGFDVAELLDVKRICAKGGTECQRNNEPPRRVRQASKLVEAGPGDKGQEQAAENQGV